MPRFVKLHKESIGLAPEDIVFRGVQKLNITKFRTFQYSNEELFENEYSQVEEFSDLFNDDLTLWLNIDGLHDVASMEKISKLAGIEDHIMADVLNTYSRPKINEFDDGLFFSLKMLRFEESENLIVSENLVLLLKDNLLLSFQEQVGDVFNPIRERLRKNKRNIRENGAAFLAYALIDIVVDNYIYVISRIGDKIENLDEKLSINADTSQLNEINELKSEMNFLRKAIKPCRELILNFIKMESDLVDDRLEKYMSELQNNIELANESVDSYREMLSDQLNIFHTNVSYKLNDIIKFLTIFSVIFIPITFIAGVYGTNFDNLPELHFQYSYFIMWGVIISVVLFMVFYFKRKKWL
ncbi:MAG: magnesium/cobalt transporter CorA [Bacteroidales bacterium]|nr:magnesium/cobalt transporter CorA [Bacteroidales bacterium]